MRSWTAPRPCPLEADVLELARTHRWPARADADLLEHASRCEACREVALVAAALGAEWDAASCERAPLKGRVVWWRAQRRARVEAARAAARPAGWAHATAVFVAIALLGWTAWSSAGQIGAWFARLDTARWMAWLVARAQDGAAAPSVLALAGLAAAVVLALVVAPVALWLTLSDS